MNKKTLIIPLMLILLAISVTSLTCYPSGRQATLFTRGHLCVDSWFDSYSYSCQGNIYYCAAEDEYYCELADTPEYNQCENGCDINTGLCKEGAYTTCRGGEERCNGKNVERCYTTGWQVTDQCNYACTENNGDASCQLRSAYYCLEDNCIFSSVKSDGDTCFATSGECLNLYNKLPCCDEQNLLGSLTGQLCKTRSSNSNCEQTNEELPCCNELGFYDKYILQKTCHNSATCEKGENMLLNLLGCLGNISLASMLLMIVPMIYFLYKYKWKGLLYSIIWFMTYSLIIGPILGLSGMLYCFIG